MCTEDTFSKLCSSTEKHIPELSSSSGWAIPVWSTWTARIVQAVLPLGVRRKQQLKEGGGAYRAAINPSGL